MRGTHRPFGMIRKPSLAACLIGALLSTSAVASTISGTGLPSFNAAVVGGAVIDFESNAPGTDDAVTLNYTDVSMTGNSTLRISGAYNNQYNVAGNTLALTTNDGGNKVVFEFAGLVDAFGFNIGGTDVATWRVVAYSATGATLDSLLVPVLTNTNNGDYLGIAMSVIASSRLINDSSNPDYVVVDNFTYAKRIPKSLFLALIGIGIAGIGYRRRTRTR